MKVFNFRFCQIGFLLLLVLMVCLGIAPTDRTVWMVESVWSIGLLAILLVTRKRFKFSTAAKSARRSSVRRVMSGMRRRTSCATHLGRCARQSSIGSVAGIEVLSWR